LDGTVSNTGFTAQINPLAGTLIPPSNSISWMAIGT
jgi:hypothetical protein